MWNICETKRWKLLKHITLFRESTPPTRQSLSAVKRWWRRANVFSSDFAIENVGQFFLSLVQRHCRKRLTWCTRMCKTTKQMKRKRTPKIERGNRCSTCVTIQKMPSHLGILFFFRQVSLIRPPWRCSATLFCMQCSAGVASVVLQPPRWSSASISLFLTLSAHSAQSSHERNRSLSSSFYFPPLKTL